MAAETPPAGPDPGMFDRQSALVRARAGIHDWIGQAGRGLLHATPTAIVTGMTAAALAPLLLPLLGGVATAGVVGQILAQLGNIGADYVSNMARDTMARLSREAAVTAISEETVRNVLERRMEADLADSHAAELRAEMAGVLAAVNGVGTTLEAAFRSDVDGLAAHIGQAVRDISETVSEFAGLRADVLTALGDIQGDVTRTLALQEDTLTLQRDASHKLEVVSTEIALLRRAFAVGRPGAVPQTSLGSEPGGTGPGPGGLPDVYPYPGLEPFRETDAFWFHGRDRLTVALLKRLRGLLRGSSPLMVVGASGAGKSSLLSAGLIHELAEGDLLAGSPGWPSITMTPGPAPIRQLATWLAIRAELPTSMVLSEIEADPRRAPLIVRQALLTREERRRRGVRPVLLDPGAGWAEAETSGTRRLVVVIDQFEEVFTLCPPPERLQFIEAVCAMAAGSAADPPPALVVIGLRAGFVADCTAHPPLEPALREQFIVGPMSTAELRAAIEQPARDAGLTVEPGLADAMLSDLGAVTPSVSTEWPTYDPGALPLLAHALRETWERRDRGHMTVAAYHAAGGIKRAIAQKADEVYHRLDEAGQQVARELLAHMVSVRSDAEDTRRRMSRTALLAELPPSDADTAAQILDLLERERLVTADGETVQIAHEALLRHWPRLTAWLDEDRAWHRLRQRLTEQAREWEEGNRHRDRLLRGAQLSAVTEQLTRARRAGLGVLETAFLRASSRRETRSHRTRMAFMSALTAAVLVAAGFAVVAQHSNEEAQQQRAIAESRQLAARAQTLAASAPATSLALSLEAYRIQHTTEAVSSLLTAQSSFFTDRLASPTGPVNAVAYDPADAGILASAGTGAVTLWRTATGKPVATLHGRSLFYDVAFDPAGHLLAGAEANGTTVLWDLRDMRQTGTLTVSDGASVDAVAFSPDGRLIATAGWDGIVTLWRTKTLTKVRTLPVGGGAVWGIAFSPDGTRLAAACSDHGVRIWDLARPISSPPLILTGHTASVRAVAFSPDSRLLASAADDGTVRLWNPRSGALLSVLASGLAPVRSVAFSPDGRTIASGSDFPDDSLRIWDVATGSPIAALTGPANAIGGVAFSPDGRTIASADTDATVGLWQIVGPPPHSGAIATVTAAPTRGGPIATATGDQRAELWSPRRLGRPVVINGLPARPGAASATGGPGTPGIALSAGGTLLAAPSATGVMLRSVTGHGETRTLTTPLPVDSVAFQPATGTGSPPAIAAGSTNDQIYVWPRADAPVLAFSGQQQGPVNVVEFSPDGRYLAAGGSDGTIVIARLDLVHGVPSATVVQQAPGVGPVRALAFSPDGQTLASATGRTVLLWHLADDGHHLTSLATLTGPTQDVLSVSFSNDSGLLAAAAADHTVSLWDVASPGSPRPFATLSGLSTATGVAFIPGTRTLAGATWEGTAQFWDTNPAQVARRICASHPAVTPAALAPYLLSFPYQPVCPATG